MAYELFIKNTSKDRLMSVGIFDSLDSAVNRAKNMNIVEFNIVRRS